MKVDCSCSDDKSISMKVVEMVERLCERDLQSEGPSDVAEDVYGLYP